MSTRSAFGTLENGHFRGRYIHSDGYPSYNGVMITRLLQRDGVERTLQVLTQDHYGWSSLIPDLPELTLELRADLPNIRYDFENPAHSWSYLQPGEIQGDGRFVGVPGYGIAYTTEEGQSDPNEWVEFSLGDTNNLWIEWAYAVEMREEVPHLTVIKLTYSADVLSRKPVSTPVEKMFNEELLLV